MPIQQGVRTLPLYDILATLFPGAILLIGISVIIGVRPAILSSTSAAVFFVVFGYLAGAVLRWAGRKMEGRPVLFSNTLKSANVGGQEGSQKEKPNLIVDRIFGEIPRFWGNGDDSHDEAKIEPTPVEFFFDEYVKQRFGLDDDDLKDINSGKLLQMVLSTLETTPYSRSIRFQAIHSFQRNTWAALFFIWLTTIVVAVQKIVIQHFDIPQWMVIPGTQSPSWGLLLSVFLASLLLTFVFGELKSKFNRLFVDYVFTECFLDHQSQQQDPKTR